MPDKPLLPENHDFTPLQVEIVSQSLEVSLEKEKIKEEFDSSKHTLEESFAWLWSQEKLQTIVELEDEYNAKSYEEANNHRRDGNRYFAKNSFLSAVDCYTQSLRCAPETPPPPSVDENEQESFEHELPLAYANRSAALLRLRRFQLCIRDTELAIEYGFPVTSQYKLFERRGRAYAEMGSRESAKECFERARELLVVSDLKETQRQKWRDDIGKHLENCAKMNPALVRPKMDSSVFHCSEFFNTLTAIEKGTLNRKKEPEKLPRIRGGPNKNFPCASQDIQLQYSDNKGRYLIAKEDIDIGDTLVVEKPVASVLLPEYYGSHCYACFEKLTAPIPCSSCTTIVFCSKRCRDDNWDRFHKYECKQFALFRYNWMGKLGHLAHRLILTFGIPEIIKYIKNNKERKDIIDPLQAGRSKDGVYNNDINSVFSLVTNIETRIPESIFDFGVFASFLVKLLRMSGFLAAQSQPDVDYKNEATLRQLGAALIQILMMLQCNKKGIKMLLHPTDFESPKPVDIGVALYPTAALANHNCNPSAFLVFYGNTLVMQASRCIWSGQEVSVAYELCFHNLERRQRQMSLKATFSFHCDCTACQQVWGQWRDVEAEYPNLLCKECHRAIDIANLTDNQYLTCKACRHTTDVSDCWAKLTTSHEDYSAAIEDTIHGKSEHALQVLKRHLALMQLHIEMPWKDMLACELAVVNCYKLRGNKRL